jgi:hypothetical protein
MIRIVEKDLSIEFPRGHHQHCLIAQIPNHLAMEDFACRLADPESKWNQIRTILELVAEGPGNLKKCHFLLLPESAMPARSVDKALTFIDQYFRPNTITTFGVEHIRLSEYLDFLQRYRSDNEEALASAQEDLDAGDIDELAVNWSVTAVKEANGKLRVFLQAKSHPFVGEEAIDSVHDLYRGKIFPLFRCHPTCFNFMPVICLDYVYRDLYQSNISVVIEKANELFYETRQRLDLLIVLECNPKPEHKAFRDVINGFYGEYLAYTPGVRDTITIFCNSSNRTSGLPGADACTFGYSSVIIHESHKIGPFKYPEFSSDDFGGLPVCRLRFGAGTRLYYFNLPLFHELDPRTTRVPLKIHGIFRPAGDRWVRIEDEDYKNTDTGETES